MPHSGLRLASATHSQCISCLQKSQDLETINSDQASYIYICHGVVCKSGAQKICKTCLNKSLSELEIPSNMCSDYPRSHVARLLKTLRAKCGKIELSTMTDDEVKIATRLSRRQFLRLDNMIKVGVEALLTFLIICTMGISQRHAAVILKVNQSSISRRFNKVLQSFQEQVIPHQIGLKNFTVPVIREHHTPRLFSSLFQNVVLVCDGTYIHTQKSENFKSQKKTYSMHKNRSLVKFLVFTAPNGRVVEAFGHSWQMVIIMMSGFSITASTCLSHP